ncbi:MAG TPA: class I SAM-dependent methyltransferase [Gemmatimonadaceae bacterium]|nr:class I SAM-dependent methyltransferase [Gemmatimonadaceae bacterium]
MLAFLSAVMRNAWRRNATRVRRRLLGDRGAPWMRPQEEAIVREVLTKLRPMRCLEWGAGFSTLQFPALLPDGATWLAIEHAPEWAEIMRQRNVRANVTVAQVAPDVTKWEGDGNAGDFAAYLAYPAKQAPYDFILIDGRARAAAVAAAAQIVAPNGVVILHDANRTAYAGALRPFAHQLLLRDAREHARRPAGGIWLGSMARPIHTVLDVTLHERLWRFYSGVGRVIA